jgi:zinc transporter 1/2/3
LFSLFTPFGILIGYFIGDASLLTFGVLISISSGTFVYISTSDIVSEEFSFTSYRLTKFIMYVFGGIIMGAVITAVNLNKVSMF